MSLTESAGAAFTGNNTTASATSASFTPTASGLIVLIAAVGNNTGGTATSLTVSGTGFFSGKTWTQLVSLLPNGGGGGAVWCLDAGTSPSAGTVTVTIAGGVTDIGLIVRQFAGAAAAASQTGAHSSTSGTIDTVGITPNTTGSQCVGGYGSFNGAFTLTANSVTTSYGTGQNATGGSTFYAFEANSLSTANSALTLGFTATQAGTGMFAAEIIPAAGPVSPTATLAGAGGLAGGPGGRVAAALAGAGGVAAATNFLTKWTNSFEGGTSGSAITPAGSGTGGNAFDQANTAGTGAILNWDNTHAAHGTLAAKVTLPATVSAGSYLTWSTSVGALTTVWFRMYLYHTANPSVNFRVWQSDASGVTLNAAVYIMTDGTLLFINTASATILQTVNSVPLSTWYRVEGFVTANATTGQVELKLFSAADNLSPLETKTSTAAQNTATGQNTYRFGCFAATTETTAFTVWMDDVGLSSTGYLGPSVSVVGVSATLAGAGSAGSGSTPGGGVNVTATLPGAGAVTAIPGNTVFAYANLAGSGSASGGATTALGHQSVMWYPGWLQNSTYNPYVPPTGAGSPDYSAYTTINHFGCYPNSTGGVVFTDIATGHQATTISAAHAAGLRCVLTIGSAGFGSQFVASTGASFLSAFITAIISAMTTYGYDGINIDWEESVTQTPFVNLLSGLRNALPGGASLTVDVDTGQHSSAVVAAIVPYVDFINCMTYWDDGSATISVYEGAGIPAGKLLLGVGLAPGQSPAYHDLTQAAVQAKVNFVISNSLPGVDIWSMEWLSTDTTDARLIPLRTYLHGGSVNASAVLAGAGSAAPVGILSVSAVLAGGGGVTVSQDGIEPEANGFEATASGTQLTTANSGTSGNTFDLISDPGALLQYSSAWAAHGAQCCLVSGSATNAYFGWNTAGWAVGYTRMYGRYSSLPAVRTRIGFVGDPAFNMAAEVWLETTGQVSVNCASGGSYISSGTLPLNAGWRLELQVTASPTAGQAVLRVFRVNPDEVTPDETLTSAANLNTQTWAGRFYFGVTFAASAVNPGLMLDDVAISPVTWLGPAGIGPVATPGGAGSAAVTAAVSVTASLAGSGSAAASTVQAISVSTALPGTGSAAAAVAVSVSAALAGSGGATAGTVSALSPTVTLAGAGSAAIAASGVTYSVRATLAGAGSAGSLTTSPTLEAGTLAGSGSAVSGAVIGVTAVLAGAGRVRAVVAVGPVAALAGAGHAGARNPAPVLLATAVLTGTGSAAEQLYIVDISVYAGVSATHLTVRASRGGGAGPVPGAALGDGLTATAAQGDGLTGAVSVAQR